MKGTRIYATGEQAERLIDELGGSAAEHPVYSVYFTGEQMERAIAAAGGSTAEHPVFSKYATGEQMERLIAALGGDPAEHPVQSKYATAEQAERLILALGGEPAEYPVESKYMTAEQMERLIPLAGGDPLTTFGPDALVQFTAKKAKAMTEVVVDIEPVQAGTGDPSPDNVRPITGWTGATINDSANLLPELSADDFTLNKALDGSGASVSSSYYKVSKYFPCSHLAGQRCTTNFVRSTSGASNPSFCFYSAEDESSYVGKWYKGDAASTTQTMTIPDTAKFMRLCINKASGVSSQYLVIGEDAPGETPVRGTPLAVDWSDEAGTVYGGTLTINEDGSADLVVNRRYNGLTWELRDAGTNYPWIRLPKSGSNVFQWDSSDKAASRKLFLCSKARTVVSTGSAVPSNVYNYGFWQYDASSARIYLPTGSTADDATAFMSDVQIVTPLRTPQTYHLTDVGQISTLVGMNNVWADTGDVTVTANGTALPDPDALQALNLLLGNSYSRSGDDPTDEEALDIILGGTR